jgi:hypothetical protein
VRLKKKVTTFVSNTVGDCQKTPKPFKRGFVVGNGQELAIGFDFETLDRRTRLLYLVSVRP